MAFDPNTVDLGPVSGFDPSTVALPNDAARTKRFDIAEAISGDGVVFSPQDIDVQTGLDFFTRADISLSDSFQEKRRKFKKAYPEGGFFKIKLPGREETALVFKENIGNPDEKVKTVEDVGFTASDLADITGDIPAVVGSAVATRGLSGIGAVVRGATGAMAGEVGKAAVEELRDANLQPFSEVGTQVLGVGGEALFGGAMALPVEKAVRAFRGEGMLRSSPEARARPCTGSGPRSGLWLGRG